MRVEIHTPENHAKALQRIRAYKKRGLSGLAILIQQLKDHRVYRKKQAQQQQAEQERQRLQTIIKSLEGRNQ